MSEEIFKMMTMQLRKPEGELGKQVGAKMNMTNEIINRRAIRELHIGNNEKILELGMGNGFFVKDILTAAENVHYAGSDYSELMVTEARQINKEFIKSGKAKFHNATADKLPFENETFHKVFGVNIIYFWQRPEVELAEIKRVLKPGGKLLIGIRPKESMQNYPFTHFGFNMYSAKELEYLLKNNGFKIKEIIEENEPDQEVNGKKIKVDTVLAVAEKAA